MNTIAKPIIKITARCLGPVISLDGELASKTRNLIFARNGTGKSFLSRAFRYLDHHSQLKSIADAARHLVSDEAADGKGEFKIARGEVPFGSLKLNKNGDQATADVTDTIFHVFSEDFIHEELREQQYKLNGEIENQIAVDSTNIKLSEAAAALSEAQSKEETTRLSLELQLNLEKSAELIQKAAIKKSLKDYIELTLEIIFSSFLTKPAAPKRACLEILRDLEALKSIPSVPDSPQPVEHPQAPLPDFNKLRELQKRITSPSSVADELKAKINKHTDFFRTGAAIFVEEQNSTCPFCEQEITAAEPKAIVDAYVKYFTDAEQTHKEELRTEYRILDRIEADLKATEDKLLVQKSRYDDLNKLLPSRIAEQLESIDKVVSSVREAIGGLKDGLTSKAVSLSMPGPAPDDVLLARMIALKELIAANNKRADQLNQAVHNSDNERKSLQRDLCASFRVEFAIGHWEEIESLRVAQGAVQKCNQELAHLEKQRPSANSKARAAKTFDMLLKTFFSSKYIFDKESFTLKRGDNEMSRGAHRTMSDGEKSAVAFCYFVASVHHKVKANNDYKKLYLVFDDPVTSMSYDYVFAIAQTLKTLAISDEGEVSLTADKGGKNYFGPDLLILTHSSYLYNISISNKVVDPSAAFALHPDNAVHKLAPLSRYIAPFNEHLKDIWAIFSGARQPDHTTGNAIRSVLEAIGRFCRPDKCNDLTAFVMHLTNDCGFSVKSVLINSMSHGTYYDEVPSPDDLKVACTETIAVVEKFAPGQIELLKAG